MSAADKQRAIGIGLSRALSSDTARGRARLRRGSVTLDREAKAGFRVMRKAEALVRSVRASAPRVIRRFARPSGLYGPPGWDQGSASLQRASAGRDIRQRRLLLGAAKAIPGAVFIYGGLLAERGAAGSRLWAANSPRLVHRLEAGTAAVPPKNLRQAAALSVAGRSRRLYIVPALRTRRRAWSDADRAPIMPSLPCPHLRLSAGQADVRRMTVATGVGVAPAPAASPAPLNATARRASVAPVEAGLAAASPLSRGQISAASGRTSATDTTQIGRWLTDYLTDAAMRPPSGVSGLDDRLTPVFAGMVGFG
jgi:hypothetical protein